MIRARFLAYEEDPRPVDWPIKHPFWVTGITATKSGVWWVVVVAYADDVAEIRTNWPEAHEIESEPADKYVFSARFPKPDWFTEPKDNDHEQVSEQNRS